MYCKNCSQIVKGNYCSHCGQNANVDKLSISTLLDDLSESIFQINKGFVYTLLVLLRKPGRGIREYLEGKRKRYYKPIAYLLVLSTIYFLITQVSGQNTLMDDLITGFAQGALDKEDSTKIPTILSWFSKNYAYTTLLLLPVFSLASYIGFRKFETNYLEHFVLNSYVTGQQAIFYSIFALFQTFVGFRLLEALPITISLSYAIWVFMKFFKTGNRFMIFLRSIITYVLYLIFSGGILIVLIGITEIFN